MMMHFDIFTLFPGMFSGAFDDSIIRRAWLAGHISIALHDIREYATGKHRVVDDTPYGGGGGMVMKPEPVFAAVESVLGTGWTDHSQPPIILLSPQGRPFDQSVARELSTQNRLALICGRYEGIDERVRQQLITDEISIGDYVLSGGEIAAMVVLDALTRLLPGVLGDPAATAQDSHTESLLEHPHYTRPAEFRGESIPAVLLSGHHAEINKWRRHESLRRTLQRRPDLLTKADLSTSDREFLRQLGWTSSDDE
jgi:tRNA (guanine37-N1)-methyltransferase